MRVTAILKGVKDALGKRTVYIRITNGDNRQFKSLNIRLTDAQFKSGKVVNHPDHKILNEKINREINRAELGLIEPKPKKIAFKSYCMECFREWRNTKEYETLRHYISDMNKIENFKSVNIGDIDLRFLQDLEGHLYKIGNKTNTVWRTMKFLRTIILKAKRERLIPESPFDLYKMPVYRDPKKVYLLREQVDQIEEFSKGNHHPSLILSATWFVIGCYTGLRYSDMAAFNKKCIRGGRLTITTIKTGEIVSLPYTDRFKELFERVDFKPLPYTNQAYNRHLKAIQEICEISEPITAHTSRHSAAMLLANAGVSQEVTAKILGHTKLATTAIYYRITNSRIDDEFKKML